MALVSFVGERLAEFLVSPRATDVFVRASPGHVEADWIIEVGNNWKSLFDLDGVRPAIAEVIEILERSRTYIFDGGKKCCFARV
ncbi:hypothetical protein FHT85_006142 [Rhizobium sp. BK312]|nr:hypothetical protein [Rhizobium sp. BK312]